MTIAGGRADNTIIERATDSVFFRLIHVASIGTLKLEGLTLQGGNAETNTAGGSGIFNRGRLTLSHVVLTNNGNFSSRRRGDCLLMLWLTHGGGAIDDGKRR